MKRLVILGAGESGVGTAILAKKLSDYKDQVFVSDFGTVQQKYKDILGQHNIMWEEGKHTESAILSADEVVKSPGIPEKAPIIKKLKDKGIPVISEIEFAGRYTKAKTICITGSNGKTTTTTLIHRILTDAGLSVGLAGNIGHSFAWQVAEGKHDIYVIELSSFQLDGMTTFKADIAVLLNITPDHLDRYEYDFQLYVDSKMRIVQNQTLSESLVYCADDPVIAQEIQKRDLEHTVSLVPFSLQQEPSIKGAWLHKDELNILINGEELTMNLDELALKGKHNVYNSMAAAIAAKLSQISNKNIRDSLRGFEGVEHRLEEVPTTLDGIRFINDSKATNVNSTWYALESIKGKVIWIAGGVDKGNDYECLKELAYYKVDALICLGLDNEKLLNSFGKITRTFEVASMDQAVIEALELAEKGTTILLSPACASFDLFKNYVDRGLKFKEAVRKLVQ